MFGYLLVDFFDKRPVALLATDDVTLFKSTALAFPRAVARPRKFWRSYDVIYITYTTTNSLTCFQIKKIVKTI
jgi:hypothetical protein